jgi:hypothetical protein
MSDPAQQKPRGDLNPIPDEAQRIFDVVGGPNLRLKDNLIQLGIVVVGALSGVGIGAGLAWRGGGDVRGGIFIGLLAGAFVSLVLSGVVLGLLRFIGAFSRR